MIRWTIGTFSTIKWVEKLFNFTYSQTNRKANFDCPQRCNQSHPVVMLVSNVLCCRKSYNHNRSAVPSVIEMTVEKVDKAYTTSCPLKHNIGYLSLAGFRTWCTHQHAVQEYQTSKLYQREYNLYYDLYLISLLIIYWHAFLWPPGHFNQSINKLSFKRRNIYKVSQYVISL